MKTTKLFRSVFFVILSILCSPALFAESGDVYLLNNQDNLLPFRNLSDWRFESLSAGTDTVFEDMLGRYAPLNTQEKPDDYGKARPVLLVGIFDVDLSDPNRFFGIKTDLMDRLHLAERRQDVVIFLVGPATALKPLQQFSHLLYSPEDSPKARKKAGRLVFGAEGLSRKIGTSLAEGVYAPSLPLTKLGRLQFDISPTEAGFDEKILSRADEIAAWAIEQKMTPGCQILAAKDGKVFFNKSYGTPSYQEEKSVKNSDLYDLASLTKVTACLPAVMKLYDSKKLKLDGRLADYLPEYAETNKKHLTIAQLLTHTAGLQAGMPGWFETFQKEKDFRKYYRKTVSDSFSIQVADSLFAAVGLSDSLSEWVKRSPVSPARANGTYGYRYSDVGFYLLKEVCEKLSGQSLEDYTETHFYQPLGLHRMRFRPNEVFDNKQIMPTGYDTYFRKTFLDGYVNDYAAAMENGAGGHAGLFSDAASVAVLMQLFLQNGSYGGIRILSPETVRTFAARPHAGSRRAHGWDKPYHRSNGRPNPAMASEASEATFGHTGFTGTCAWADPENGLIFVFLSNRSSPDLKNRKLINQHIRRKIHEVFYAAAR